MNCGSPTVLNQSPHFRDFVKKKKKTTIKFLHTPQTSQPNTIIKFVVNREIPPHPNTDEGVREREMLLFSTNVHLHGGDSGQIDQSIL